MKILTLTMLAAVAALPAGSDPAGFALWKSAELRSYEKKLGPKINAQKVAGEPLAQCSNHRFAISHRQGDGQAEWHEIEADLFVVESGEATLVVGGRLVDGKPTAPHEMLGASIAGGSQKKLATGDIVHIPSKTPHQLLVAPGKQFTYFVLKVTE
jgi:mannose-6-phosphate isomerase-like protein (cupin superfamily)